ncbi:DUF805 domain-containing protein [Dehalococcoidia bacterium]|nr:DUF805 domain-containing protein [Dehalococcoidia bacterium]
MKCTACGKDNPDNAQFCGICGTAIGEPSGDDSTIVGRRKDSTSSGFGAQSFFDTTHLKYLIFSTEGRINRQRYFFGFLLLWAVGFVAALLLERFAPGLSPLLLVIFLAMTVILGIKRMHDRNHSGWFLLFCFVPIVHLLAYGYLFLAPGTTGSNRFGDDSR